VSFLKESNWQVAMNQVHRREVECSMVAEAGIALDFSSVQLVVHEVAYNIEVLTGAWEVGLDRHNYVAQLNYIKEMRI
jgi:hypothetical protein